MRQPLAPLPRRRRRPGSKAVSSRTSCGARQAASCVISARVQRARALAVAGDGEHADLGEVDDHRLAAQRRAPLDQLARLLQRLRLVLGERVHPEVELDLAVERHRAACRAARAGSPCGPGRRSHTSARLTSSVHSRPGSGYSRASAPRWSSPASASSRVALAQVLRVAARLLGRPLAHAALLRPAHAERERQQQQRSSPPRCTGTRCCRRRSRSRPSRRRRRPGRAPG